MLTKTEQHIFTLKEIHCRIDAISAAVEGADMNDTSQQRGIRGFLGDVWCKMDDLIKELEAKAEGQNDD